MTFPDPVPGLVIRYGYLWREEHKRGQEEGLKDRPCAIVLAAIEQNGDKRVVVLPVTHSPPDNPGKAIEIPAQVNRRLGLDDQRSWIVLSEANRFVWPGPDLRPARRGDPGSVVFGQLPFRFFADIQRKFIQALKERRATTVPRSPA
jgi:hypothetical protein